MKRVFSRIPKKLLVALAVTGTVIGVGATVNAWWPQRPTFTVAHPAPYVTFNSITDNPNYGDERTFFDAKNSTNTQSGGYGDKVKVTDGETLLVRTYVHNNAADNLNTVPDGHGGFKGIAQNAKVRVYLPTATATALRANSYVSASNATPGEVSDTVDFYGDRAFNVSYVPGSALTYNNAHPKGMALSDQIVNGGAPLGYQNLDGKFPGCFKYVNIVTIRVKVHMQNPGLKITKQVAIPGQPWTKNVTVDPGQQVSYLLTVSNTGNTQLDHVSVRDKLPAHQHIVPGSTFIYNSNHPSGISAGSDAVVSNGIDTGSYAVGGGAYVKFKATVDSQDQLTCGVNKMVNTGEVFQPGHPATSDTAEVLANKKCENPTPFFECSNLDLSKTGGRMVQAEVTYRAVNGAQFNLASIDFGDKTAPTVTNKTANSKVVADHTYAKDDTYIVRATLTFTVSGQDKTVTSDNCVQTVSFSTKKTTTPPKELPNTGAGNLAGIFAATTVAGAMAHKFWSRRLSR